MGASRFAETEQNFAGALLTSPPQAPGPGRRADGHENLTEASGTEKRFAGAPLTSPLQGPGPAGHART